MAEIVEIWKLFGPVLGPVVLFALAYQRGYLATGRELKQANDATAFERAERIRERQELRSEISFWREQSWLNGKTAEQVAGVLPPRSP